MENRALPAVINTKPLLVAEKEPKIRTQTIPSTFQRLVLILMPTVGTRHKVSAKYV